MDFPRLVGVFGLGLLTLVAMGAKADPSTMFTVTGDLSAPATLMLADLQSLPTTTDTATYRTGTGPQTGTFTGPTLWTLLDNAGLRGPPVKNGLLRQYVVATGNDGYSAVFSVGEHAPQFGGGNPQDLVAYEANPPLGSAGFARIVAAKDDSGGRYVSNLSRLQIGTAPSRPSQGGGAKDQFFLSGSVQTPGAYTLSSLSALPATTETVTYLAAGNPVTATFTGVSIWTLLTDAGIVTNAAVKNDILNYYLLATGSDGYEAVFSLGELDPMFGGAGMPDMVAYMENGSPIAGDGFARVTVPGDNFGGRYVSNLVSLEVIRAVVPEPGSLVLIATSLIGMGLSLVSLYGSRVSAKLARWRGLHCVSTSDPGRRSAMARSACSKPSEITVPFRRPGARWECRIGARGC
jgi:hypothetical protein